MFANNTATMIMKEMAQWQVNGEISGSDDIAPGGAFYEEAASEIKSALMQGGFPPELDTTTPIALNYIAALHRKLTAILYIQARRINITVDGEDGTRGMWGNIRAKLKSIGNGEPFGELSKPRAGNLAAFYTYDDSAFSCCMDLNRSL